MAISLRSYLGIFQRKILELTRSWQIPLLYSYERNLEVVSRASKSSWILLSFPSKNSSTIASIFGGKIHDNQSQQSMSSVYLFQNRSEYWTFSVPVVALWILWMSSKPDNDRFSRGFILVWTHNFNFSPIFLNLIRRKYFRIQVNLTQVWKGIISMFLRLLFENEVLV